MIKREIKHQEESYAKNLFQDILNKYGNRSLELLDSLSLFTVLSICLYNVNNAGNFYIRYLVASYFIR